MLGRAIRIVREPEVRPAEPQAIFRGEGHERVGALDVALEDTLLVDRVEPLRALEGGLLPERGVAEAPSLDRVVQTHLHEGHDDTEASGAPPVGRLIDVR